MSDLRVVFTSKVDHYAWSVVDDATREVLARGTALDRLTGFGKAMAKRFELYKQRVPPSWFAEEPTLMEPGGDNERIAWWA